MHENVQCCFIPTYFLYSPIIKVDIMGQCLEVLNSVLNLKSVGTVKEKIFQQTVAVSNSFCYTKQKSCKADIVFSFSPRFSSI